MTQTGAVIWITGVPGTGKSTLAKGLTEALAARDIAHLWLDSDDLRAAMPTEADYSERGRDRFYAMIGHLAMLGVNGGVVVVVSATASKRHYRDDLRGRVERFYEVWLHCSDAALAKRDIKGLYAAAAAGEISTLPGKGSPYQAPLTPELEFDTGPSGIPIDARVAQILAFVGVHGKDSP